MPNKKPAARPACQCAADRTAATKQPLRRTPDGRYLIVRGRLWRTSNPDLSAEEREAHVAALMRARRDVRAALDREDAADLRAARARVQQAKVALGERGPVWWTDSAPDLNRRLVLHTPYAEWWQTEVKCPK